VPARLGKVSFSTPSSSLATAPALSTSCASVKLRETYRGSASRTSTRFLSFLSVSS
jgi:hypothetical protein